MIRVEDLCKRYGTTRALAGVSFEVARGEVVGLLGPNGAGKTTCLRILTCFARPDSGRVAIDGLDPTTSSLEIRRRIGYLSEGAPIYPELRVCEYLDHRARLKQLPRARRAGAIARVEESCGLGEVRRRLVGQLSHGYRQRLGIADALLGAPPLLVLDEPTVGLDPNQIRELRQLVRSLGGEHTVLLSTHILPEVEAVCSRALVLHRGELVAEGPVKDLLARTGQPGACTLTARIGPADDPSALTELLGQVEGVEQVEQLMEARLEQQGGTAVRCRLRGPGLGPTAREIVVARILARGWALSELTAEDPSLEEAFARLTTDARGGAA